MPLKNLFQEKKIEKIPFFCLEKNMRPINYYFSDNAIEWIIKTESHDRFF